VRGFNATEGLPEPHASRSDWRREMGLALVDTAAALAAVDPVAHGLEDFGRLEGFLERQVPRWRSQLASYAEHRQWPGPDRLPHVAEISEWLDAHRPAGFSPGIIHGDYHLANVLFDFEQPTLAAVVDWELSTLGDPLLDLGWLLATWPDPSHDPRPPMVQPWDGFPTPAELVERYAERSGRAMDALPWFAVLACFKLGVILESTFARACAGLAPIETGERLHASTLNLFERASRLVSQAPSGVL
jgi:aminoglycoside phosphotransferase (APT) family kinase protein